MESENTVMQQHDALETLPVDVQGGFCHLSCQNEPGHGIRQDQDLIAEEVLQKLSPAGVLLSVTTASAWV